MAVHFHPQPKPRPAALEREDRRKARKAKDEKESAKVKARSGGRCEVVDVVVSPDGFVYSRRCPCLAMQTHHMIGGRGQRARGISVLAKHKQYVCDDCHRDITGGIGGKRLRRIGGTPPLWTDCYERVR